MANPYGGEVGIVVDGHVRQMKLTLGALAELEDELGESSLVALVARFETGGFSSRDVMALLVAGLRGGGWSVRAGDLVSAHFDGGPLEAARKAATLLVRAFAEPGSGR